MKHPKSFWKLYSICILGVTVLTCSVLSSAQKISEVPDGKGIVYSDCLIPYQPVVWSITSGTTSAYMLTEGKYFNKNDLSTLFACLSKRYPEFPAVSITLFSDRANLDVAIRNHFDPPDHENPMPDTRELDCRDLKSAREPCPYGYFRASYYRFKEREYFDFSEDRTKVSMRRVLVTAKTTISKE